MYEQVSGTLAGAIEELEIPVDRRSLLECFRLYDRYTAKLVGAVGEFDAAEAWRDAGATSMTAWLRHLAGRSGREAASFSKTARRLRDLPGTAAAYGDGRLSTGQVQAIVANLSDRTVPLFAEQEDDLLSSLAALPVREVSTVMQAWQSAAKDFLDEPDKPAPPERSLHLSKTLDGRRELSGSLDPEAGAVVETALRLASTDDVEGEPMRTPAERRADAMVDIMRFFLDHQDGADGGRNRPHLNVLLDYENLVAGKDGQLFDGTVVDAATIARLACDAGINRVVMRGRSEVLDYGRTTRTISASLWAALVARDQHCRFPGCDRSAEWCEGHHVVFWENGGETNLANLLLACTRHHHLLHEGGWTARMRPDGVVEFTDPNGRIHESHPPGKPPDLFTQWAAPPERTPALCGAGR